LCFPAFVNAGRRDAAACDARQLCASVSLWLCGLFHSVSSRQLYVLLRHRSSATAKTMIAPVTIC
jgi:hypothetical protein